MYQEVFFNYAMEGSGIFAIKSTEHFQAQLGLDLLLIHNGSSSYHIAFSILQNNIDKLMNPVLEVFDKCSFQSII